MSQYKDITVAITSCWRYNLLQKTITTIQNSINISWYKKIMTEDSRDKKHISKIKDANQNGFLKWRTIIYTWGSNQSDVLKCHYFALKKLYDSIDTEYVFHCEDDQEFYKVDYDFIQLSKKILDHNTDIAIITLRDLKRDYGISKEGIMKTRYYDILTDEEEDFYGHHFIYGNKNSLFNLQPWLRRTDVMKKAMFWYEQTINETLVSQRIASAWYKWIYIDNGVYFNPDRRRNSTRNIKTMWIGYITTTIKNAMQYRFRLFKNYFYSLFQ